MLMPSLVFLLAWLCTMSMSTTSPSLWASSTRAFSSSGVPNLLLACRKEQKEWFLGVLMHSFKFLVHNVDEHHQPEPVGLVSKSLQLTWSAKSAAGLQERTERKYFQSVCRQLYC